MVPLQILQNEVFDRWHLDPAPKVQGKRFQFLAPNRLLVFEDQHRTWVLIGDIKQSLLVFEPEDTLVTVGRVDDCHR